MASKHGEFPGSLKNERSTVRLQDVANILANDHILISDWKRFFYSLKKPSRCLDQWEKSYSNRTMSIFDIFIEILSHWVTEVGKEANVERLHETLISEKFVSVAESLGNQYDFSTTIVQMEATICSNQSWTVGKERLLLVSDVELRRLSDLARQTSSISISDDYNMPDSSKSFNFATPRPEKYFQGRDDVLEEIENFRAEGFGVLNLTGFDGIGKSQIAAKYASLISETCNVSWFKGKDWMTLRRSLVKFLVEIFKVSQVTDENKVFEEGEDKIIRDMLERVKNITREWVVVIDNIDEGYPELITLIKELVKVKAFVILTTRKVGTLRTTLRHHMDSLPILGLSSKSAVTLIQRTLKTSLNADAVLLYSRLQGHPAALHASISYIRQKQLGDIVGSHYGIKDFLDELDLMTGLGVPCKDNDDTMAAVLKVTLPTLETNVYNCLTVLSLLHSDEVISFHFLASILLKVLGTNESNDIFDNYLRRLKEYGLISAERSNIMTHRLVQATILRQLETDECRKHQILSSLVNWLKDIPSGIVTRDNSVHLSKIWENIRKGKVDLLVRNVDVSDIIFQKLRDVSVLLEAQSFSEQAHAMLEANLGAEHKKTLVMQGNMYQAMFHLGKYDDAARELKLLYRVLQDKFGENDLDTMKIGDDLARALHFSGKDDEGLILSLRLLNQRQNLYGFDSRDTLMAMNNIAVFLSNLNEGLTLYADALEIHNFIYNIRKVSLGEDDVSTINTRHQIAFCKLQMGISTGDQTLVQEAKKELRAIVSKRVDSLGDAHKETLRSQHWLAMALYSSNKEGEAMEALVILRDVLKKRKNVLREDHKETIATKELIEKISCKVDHDMEYV